MTTINFLSLADTIYPGDLLPVWSTYSSDTRRISINQLGQYYSSNYTFRDSKINTYIAPNNNDTINITTNGGGAWVVIDGNQDIPVLTINFPSITNLKTGEEIIINVGNINILSVILSPNGSNVINFPTTLVNYGYLKYRYNQISNTWYNQFL